MSRYFNGRSSPTFVLITKLTIAGLFGCYIFYDFGIFAPILGIALIYGMVYGGLSVVKWDENKKCQSKFLGDMAIFNDNKRRRLEIHKDRIVYDYTEILTKNISRVNFLGFSTSDIHFIYHEEKKVGTMVNIRNVAN